MKKTHNLIQAAAMFALCAACELAIAGPVNVNTADAETIAAELTGVGINKARAIIAYRNANGDFEQAEQLALVKGIGARTVELNQANILLEDEATKAVAAAEK